METIIPSHSWFTKLINVDSQLEHLRKLVHSGTSAWRIRHVLEELNEYLLYVENRHRRSLHPHEIAQLERAREVIAEAKIVTEFPAKLLPELALLRKELEKPFQISSVYLLRHPEKPSQQDEGKRKLSFNGVHQARDFALYLAEEISLCPRPVQIRLYCSDLRRTFLFGMIIKQQLERLQRERHKEVTCSEVTQHPALYSRFSPAALEQTGPDVREKGEFAAFSNWLKGKYSLAPDAQQVSREIKSWAVEGTRTDSSKAWNVIVGISHSWIIDTMLHGSVGRNHQDIIELADYVRFVGGEMDYQGKWYVY